VFDAFDPALEFASTLGAAPGIVKKEVCFFGAPVSDHMTALAEHLPKGCHSVILVLADSSLDAMRTMLAEFGGRLTYCKTAAESGTRTLLEYTWNHTTLVAFKSDPAITYLQSAFTPGQHLEQVREMERKLGGEVLMHAEFIRNLEGQVTCTALQIVKLTTEQRLQEIMAIHRASGVRINDPHVHIVEDGKAGGELPQAVIATKKRFDPHGLLNPGKVRAWLEAAPQ
jgi:hypothetical protein